MANETKTKGMCIATRCTNVDQFVQMFHRFVDEDSFFVSTHNTRPPGLETSFSVQLADGTPVLRGMCVVLQAWTDANNVFKTPGVRLGIKRLTASSMAVFERLLVTRSAAPPPPPPPVSKEPAFDQATTQLSRRTEDDEPEIETRTPGSDLVLPANPLMNLTDASLQGYVDCTLYEETGNFFPADDDPDSPIDDLVPPPVLAPRPAIARAASPVAITVPPPLVTVTSVAMPLPLPGNSVVAPLPVPVPGTATSVVTPLPAAPPRTPISVVTPLPAAPIAAPAELTPNPNRETPIPAGERIDLEPTARKRPRYWIIGGAGVVAVAALAIVAAAKGSHESSKPPGVAPAAHREVAAPTAPTAPTAPSPSLPAEVDVASPAAPAMPPPDDDEPSVDGLPVLGTGPCRLAVATTPAGSMVTLDGKVLAPSPLTVATSCEAHAVEIAHPRYKAATRQITLTEGKDASLDVTLDRPTHSVSVTSTPPGATIFIDGRRAGTTPTVLSVMGFQQLKLEIKKTGYQPQTTKLYSKVAQDKVAVRLNKW